MTNFIIILIESYLNYFWLLFLKANAQNFTQVFQYVIAPYIYEVFNREYYPTFWFNLYINL